MHTAISSLRLSQFRNLAALELASGLGMVVITGPNGSGKTNILEALSLLGAGRGLRGATLAQLTRQGAQSGWAVAAEVARGGDMFRLGTGQLPGQPDKRQHRLEGEPLRGQGELAALLTLLWQTPQMDSLFVETGSARRFYFDRITSAFNPDHAGNLARYDYVRRERARLLEQRRGDASWLESLERKMAESTLAIAAARVETAGQLQAAIGSLHPAFPQARISLVGNAESGLQHAALSALQLEDALVAELAQNRAADATSGRTASGAHRTELQVILAEKNQEAALCSTGEQKALLLSLLLAQTQALANATGRLPVLLLDEVVAHLDAARRAALFEALGQLGAQCWFTGTGAEFFAGLQSPHRHFRLADGVLQSA